MLKLAIALLTFGMVAFAADPGLKDRLVELIDPVPQDLPPGKGASARVMLPADWRGHFQTKMTVNGRPMKAMVDTGASVVALTYEDARALGLIKPGDLYDARMQTANGVAGAKRVRLKSVKVGKIALNDVTAIVGQEGALGVNLIGMNFIRKLRSFEMKNGRLILEQ